MTSYRGRDFRKDTPGNFMQADGVANWDVTLAKRFRIREGHFLQFRMEAFNTFNHPTFGVPQYRVGNAAYGVVANTENRPGTCNSV